MLKKSLSVGLVILIFIFIIIFSIPHDKTYVVEEIISPTKIKLSNNIIFEIKNLENFDDKFSENNKILASKNGITEEEAAIIRTDIQIKREMAVAVNGDVALVNKNIVQQMKESDHF